jgi:hypothetical protein
MAWLFSLSVECGDDRSTAEKVSGHFENCAFDLITGKHSVCRCSIHEDEQAWWVVVAPSNVTRSGVASVTDAVELTELGLQLRARLLTAPPFRYAMAGVEVDDFASYSDLLGIVVTRPDDKTIPLYFQHSGLVISKEMREAMGRPIGFTPFGERHLSTYYAGELYSPESGAGAHA